MFRILGNLSLVVLIVAASIGLAGGGPWWLAYVGTGTLFLLLLLILSQLANIPDRNEVKAMMASQRPEFDTGIEYSEEESRIVHPDEKVGKLGRMFN